MSSKDLVRIDRRIENRYVGYLTDVDTLEVYKTRATESYESCERSLMNLTYKNNIIGRSTSRIEIEPRSVKRRLPK